MIMDWSFIDWISILSFIVGLQNLELNQKQVDNEIIQKTKKYLVRIRQFFL